MSSDPTNKDSLGLALPDTTPGITRWVEEENLAKLLMILRQDFQTNPAIRECLTAATREERKQGIMHFKAMDAVCFGGTRVLERAVEYLLAELEQMQADGHGQYLVDVSTGKAVAPLTKEMLFKQPDFVNEAGQLVRGKTIVNPGVSSAIGLAKQEQERTRLALQQSGGRFDHAYEHLKDPDSIVRVAREHLEAAKIPEAPEGSAELVLEVGHEHHDGVHQSPNTGFHRHAVYGALIARKIASAGHAACTIVGLERKSNSKVRWYEVKALVPAQSAAETPSSPTP